MSYLSSELEGALVQKEAKLMLPSKSDVPDGGKLASAQQDKELQGAEDTIR